MINFKDTVLTRCKGVGTRGGGGGGGARGVRGLIAPPKYFRKGDRAPLISSLVTAIVTIQTFKVPLGLIMSK